MKFKLTAQILSFSQIFLSPSAFKNGPKGDPLNVHISWWTPRPLSFGKRGLALRTNDSCPWVASVSLGKGFLPEGRNQEKPRSLLPRKTTNRKKGRFLSLFSPLVNHLKERSWVIWKVTFILLKESKIDWVRMHFTLLPARKD